jgi:hypothetical protein
MSSRALRRLQKQQEEERALQAAQAQEAAESSDEEVAAPAKQTKSAFAFLDQAEEDNDEDHDDDDEPAVDAKTRSTLPKASKPSVTDSPQPKTSKKKKKKKSKGDGTGSGAPKPADDEDIDAVLASLAHQSGSTTKDGQTTSQQTDEYALLSIETQHLHAINEMRRLFGRDAIHERPRQPQPNIRRRGQRMQQEGRGFPAVSLKRNIFVQGKEEWPRATTGGLGMEIVSKDPTSGVTEYRFVHSTAYQETQRQYELAVASMDPQRLVVLLQQNPYHIATLLQVSEIMKHDRQHTEAGDLLERALFAFGRTVHSSFGAAMSAGKARLSFSRPENREFFLAGWRYIQDLGMRSTWRTVFEWAKLVYGLEPEEDPYALELVMDQYALRANQAEQYLSLRRAEFFTFHMLEAFAPLSEGLCQLRLGSLEAAKALVRDGLLTSRYTGRTLCSLLEIEPIPPALWAHHEAANENEALLSNMYTTRAKDLWNTPEAKELLRSVATALPKSTPSNPIAESPLSLSIARHVYLTENSTFLRLLASCTLEGGADPGDAGERPMQDPFPPVDEVRSYDLRLSGSVGRGGYAPGIEGLGRMPREQMERLMEELARMQMVGEGEEADGGSEEEGWDSED